MRILSVQTDSLADSMSAARRRVREALTRAQVGDGTVRDIELAVGEALSNVNRHAYAGAAGPVTIEVDRSDSELTVVVADEGFATTPLNAPTTLPARTPAGGYGLYLMRAVVDRVDICVNPIGHGITVRMMRHVTGPVRNLEFKR